MTTTNWLPRTGVKSEPERVTARLDDLPLIMIPDRRVLKIEELSKRVRELEAKCGRGSPAQSPDPADTAR